jgi:transcriptional regulator of acetoin/glycerol metabolism
MLSMPTADTIGESQVKNLADQELEIIRAAYEQHNGNISAVSRELGISRNTVYKKLKEARKARSDR